MFHGDFYPPDEFQALPVVEREAATTGDTKEMATKDSLCSKLWFERLFILKVFENLDTGGTLPNGIPGR